MMGFLDWSIDAMKIRKLTNENENTIYHATMLYTTPSLEKSARKPKSSKFSRRNDKYNPKFLKLYCY